MKPQSHFDVIVVIDPRFSGGTSAAVIADVEAFSSLGLTVAIVCTESLFFHDTDDTSNARVLALSDLPGVSMPDGEVTGGVAFFHHPLAFFSGVSDGVRIRSARPVVVAHHPPFRGDGSLEYNPLAVNRQINASFGCRPWWAPVSGVVRRQLNSFSPFLTMTSDDWRNAFSADDWRSSRAAFDGSHAVVGRHSRADILKWPENRIDIVTPLAPGPGWRARVMGCPPEVISSAGEAGQGWEILPFGSIPVRDFLDGIDVFVFHYHPRWVEAFGRTVVEAVLMERPCVLDPRLKDTFGDLAMYCEPTEVPARLRKLREKPEATRANARDRRAVAVRRYGTDSIGIRLDALRTDKGIRSRSGPKSSPALQTVRKYLGLKRRTWAMKRS